MACLRGNRFTDFVAREYEFPVSIPGESYSIFTEADHQVNALLQPAAGATEIGLMFRGVGVHGPDTSIKVSLGEDSSFAGKCSQHWFHQILPQTHLSLAPLTLYRRILTLFLRCACSGGERLALSRDSDAAGWSDHYSRLH